MPELKQIIRHVKKDNHIGLNMNALVKDHKDNSDSAFSMSIPSVQTTTEETEKKRRGRPKKEDTSGLVKVEPSQRQLGMLESNTPYAHTYKETTDQLKATINGIDMMAAQIEQDLQMVRASRTLKKKYDYICELSSTAGALVSNRISAIKELDNIITNAHRLDLSRAKEVKASMQEQDDDKAIMDMYNAYVNTPVGLVSVPDGFNVSQSTFNSPSLSALPINSVSQVQQVDDPGYNQFINTPSPMMSSIMLEKNPNLKTVVVYNQETQDRFFDVIDTNTGMSVPGVERPGEFLLDRMQIDVRNGSAKNIDAGLSYPLMIIGNRRSDEF